MSVAVTRGRPPRSDERRGEILEALELLLRDRSLEEISVGDIADQVSMTRSTFYFYFDNKEAAVAALSEAMYADAASGADALFAMTGTPRDRVEAQMRGLVETWSKYQHLYRAMLDARHKPEVRESFDRGRDSFVEPVARMIDAEREAGHAPPGPSSRALATLLLEMNDHAVERLARGDALPVAERIDALVTIWLRSIYAAESGTA
jgi:AcrR family transcriptional regulator